MALSTRSPTGRPVLGTTRARQGLTGRHVFWVLVFGTLLAALGLFAAWTWYAPDLASTNSNNGPVPTQTYKAPEPAAINNPPGQSVAPPANPGPPSR
jgi:hypothetical protein